jgi:hypothetical protein
MSGLIDLRTKRNPAPFSLAVASYFAPLSSEQAKGGKVANPAIEAILRQLKRVIRGNGKAMPLQNQEAPPKSGEFMKRKRIDPFLSECSFIYRSLSAL